MPALEHYRANPEHYRQRAREYAKKYPERVAITRFKHSLQVREFLQKVKTELPCTDCGKYYPHYVMEFDHVNGDPKRIGKQQTRVAVGGLTSQRWSVVIAELLKCEVVCANCHRTRTWNRQYAAGNWGDVKSKGRVYRLQKCSCFGTFEQRACARCGGVGVLSFIKTPEGEVEGSIAYRNQPKKKCPHGHLYTADNIVWSHGHQQCRKCKRESNHLYHQRVVAKQKTVPEMVNAGEKEWREVEGIGKGIASQVVAELNGGIPR